MSKLTEMATDTGQAAVRPPEQASLLDPVRLLVLLTRQWPWLVVPPILLAAGGWLLSSQGDSRYEATSMVVLRPSTARSILEGDPSDTQTDRELQTEERLLNSKAMANNVSALLTGDIEFEATALEGTNILEITAQAGRPDTAAEAADAVANMFIEQRRARVRDDLEAAIDVVTEQIAALDEELASIGPTTSSAADNGNGNGNGNEARRARLEEEVVAAQGSLDRLRSELALPGTDARIASRAVPPSDRIAPRPMRAAVLGAMLGLFAGLGLVWLRDLLDRRIHGVDDLPEVTAELEFAGSIPRPLTRAPTGPISLVDDDVADRFRVLANALVGDQGERVTIQVTGVAEGAGTTFVAANLATSLALGGWATVLIDADLERGDQHQIFDVDEQPGIKQLLDGEPWTTVLQVSQLVHGLGIVATGARTVAEATLHQSKLNDLLAPFTRGFDIVVIDGPPILEASDAAVLAKHVDKTILVAAANQTTQPELERAINAIGRNGGRLAGVVLLEPIGHQLDGHHPRDDGDGADDSVVTLRSIEAIASTTADTRTGRRRVLSS
jgi:capsular exopolysaccharide synthesis family protein